MNPYAPPEARSDSQAHQPATPRFQLLMGCIMIASVPLIVLGSLALLLMVLLSSQSF